MTGRMKIGGPRGGEASDRDPSFAKRDKGQGGHAAVWLSLLEGGGMSA